MPATRAPTSRSSSSGTHPTWLSGPERGHIPPDIDTWIARHIAFPVIRFIGVHVLTLRTPMGRKAIAKMGTQGDPLVRVKPKQLVAAGVAARAEDGRRLATAPLSSRTAASSTSRT